MLLKFCCLFDDNSTQRAHWYLQHCKVGSPVEDQNLVMNWCSHQSCVLFPPLQAQTAKGQALSMIDPQWKTRFHIGLTAEKHYLHSGCHLKVIKENCGFRLRNVSLHLYLHGVKDMLASVEADMLLMQGCTKEFSASFTILCFALFCRTNFTEGGWPFLVECASVASSSTSKARNTLNMRTAHRTEVQQTAGEENYKTGWGKKSQS